MITQYWISRTLIVKDIPWLCARILNLLGYRRDRLRLSETEVFLFRNKNKYWQLDVSEIMHLRDVRWLRVQAPISPTFVITGWRFQIYQTKKYRSLNEKMAQAEYRSFDLYDKNRYVKKYNIKQETKNPSLPSQSNFKWECPDNSIISWQCWKSFLSKVRHGKSSIPASYGLTSGIWIFPLKVFRLLNIDLSIFVIT